MWKAKNRCLVIFGCLVILLLCCIEIPVVNANSVDTDQMPCSAVSDLGLHCLPITLFVGLQTKID